MTGPDSSAHNRAVWDAAADVYQDTNAATLDARRLTWGVWALPDDELQVLGDLTGRRVLDLGCGAAQWTAALAGRGARAIGLENAAGQLAHARHTLRDTGLALPLVQGAAERLPFRDGAFDVVGCDWGAMSFADPFLTVPECARVLRAGGVLAFITTSPFDWVALDPETGERSARFVQPYFGMHRWQSPEGSIEFSLPYGEWIALFRAHGLAVEALLEPRPHDDSVSTFRTDEDREWGQKWPLESLWKLRKE